MAYPVTPQLDAMKAVEEESRVLSDFWDWMQSQGYFIAEYARDDHAYPIPGGPDQIFADFFEIDLQEAEKERLAVLNYVRELNKDIPA